jgi:hypothetical protein
MKSVADWYASATRHAGSASSVVRQLALAGVAAVWVFRTTSGEVPATLMWPLGLILLGLFLDVLQYVWLAGKMWSFARRHEKEGTQDSDLRVSIWVTRIGYVFWSAKIVAVLFATVLLFLYLM